MTHTPPIPLKDGKNSIAYNSIEPPTRLVVFVHGFIGESIDTWKCFPELLRTTRDFAKCDVVFYGYKSLKGQVNNNALRFYRCLEKLLETETVKRGIDYDKVVLVAHSLGSIVVRRALLNAKDEKKPWLAKCRMVLFAPAHRGARVQKIVLNALPVVGRVLGGLGLLTMPVLDDLQPDSETIENLIRDSQSYIDRGEGDFTIAHTVVWAGNELVVHNEKFCSDPVAQEFEEKTHTSVCKPVVRDYEDPLHIVRAAL